MEAALLLRLFTLLSAIQGGAAATRAAQLAFLEEQAAAPSFAQAPQGRLNSRGEACGRAWRCWQACQASPQVAQRTRAPTIRRRARGKSFGVVSRLTRARFDYLVECLQADPFLGDAPADGKGRPPKTPLNLKLICVLAVLGGGVILRMGRPLGRHK